ncbi:MAG: hypothetical protein HYT62_01695 [Candidatus Yanofskybacteria bacterium]|nr:hypothetical protein [Candidatus Yanofskybacteria bacterium]
MMTRTVARTSWQYGLYKFAYPELKRLERGVTGEKTVTELPDRLLACHYRGTIIFGFFLKMVTVWDDLRIRSESFLTRYLSRKLARILSMLPIAALYVLVLSLMMVADKNPYLNEHPVTDPSLIPVIFAMQSLFVFMIIGIPIFAIIAIKCKWPLKHWIATLEKKICGTEIEFVD